MTDFSEKRFRELAGLPPRKTQPQNLMEGLKENEAVIAMIQKAVDKNDSFEMGRPNTKRQLVKIHGVHRSGNPMTWTIDYNRDDRFGAFAINEFWDEDAKDWRGDHGFYDTFKEAAEALIKEMNEQYDEAQVQKLTWTK